MQKKLIILFIVCLTIIQGWSQSMVELGIDSVSLDSIYVKNTRVEENASVPLANLNNFNGQVITFCGRVNNFEINKKEEGSPVTVKLQEGTADDVVTLVFYFKDLGDLKKRRSKLFTDKKMCFKGMVATGSGNTHITVDTTEQEKLMTLAAQTNRQKPLSKTLTKQPLQTNAYLLAGPNLDEPIITFLRKGSIVFPQYISKGWAYVQVIEKAGSNEKPASLNGFIRVQALDIRKKEKKIKL